VRREGRSGLPGPLISPTFWRRLAIGLALLVLALRAGYNFRFLAHAFALPGPNSLGEAGKVYFATQVMDGRLPFDSGLSTPYYPSIHGVLVHALVAGIGTLARLDVSGLYYAGRVVSVAATAGAYCFFWRLGRRLTSFSSLVALGLLLWMGSHEIFQHSASYRPDNWLLFMSLLACWMVAAAKPTRIVLVALVLLPVAAFHVKVTGLAVGAAVVLGLWLRHGPRPALAVASGQAGLFTLSVAGLEWISGGGYLAGLRAVTGVDFSIIHALSSMWTPANLAVPLMAAAPLFILPPLLAGRGKAEGHEERNRRQVMGVVTVFWTVTLVAYFTAASRAGSNAYYFLEPGAYGTLLIVAGLDRLRRGAQSTGSKGLRFFLLALLMCLLPATANLYHWMRAGRNMVGVGNNAMERTERVGSARFQVAHRIENRGMSCFTDDPGLNVLLREPQVIYPYLQSQMMKSGALPADLRLARVWRRTYDCIVISGRSWSYQGTTSLPDRFFQTIRKRYRRSEQVGPYEIWLPL